MCEQCGATFYAKPDKIRRGGGRFCSKPCFDLFQRDGAPVSIRLWEKVSKDGAVPEHRAEYGNCWPWTGHRTRGGYGRLYRHFPDPVLAHRLAWEIATGDVLTSDDVIGHICDVRHCVRNDDKGVYIVSGIALPRCGHLFKGAHEDNRLDMMEKNRQATGDRNGSRTHPERVIRGSAVSHAKLTEAQVSEIRSRYATGDISQTALGHEFGVHNVTISEIVRRKKWRHID